MADKQQMQQGAELIVGKCENIISTVRAAIDAVDEAIAAAAQAFGEGMEAGSDVEVAEALIALKFVLEDELMGKANAAIDAAQRSLSRHA